MSIRNFLRKHAADDDTGAASARAEKIGEEISENVDEVGRQVGGGGVGEAG